MNKMKLQFVTATRPIDQGIFNLYRIVRNMKQIDQSDYRKWKHDRFSYLLDHRLTKHNLIEYIEHYESNTKSHHISPHGGYPLLH